MDHIAESQEYGKGDFVLLDDITTEAFMANLKLRYYYSLNNLVFLKVAIHCFV